VPGVQYLPPHPHQPVEIMGSRKGRIVGESQSVLIVISPGGVAVGSARVATGGPRPAPARQASQSARSVGAEGVGGRGPETTHRGDPSRGRRPHGFPPLPPHSTDERRVHSHGIVAGTQ
jgi:hypothetical protein